MRLYNGFLLSHYVEEDRLDMATAMALEPQLDPTLISLFVRLGITDVKTHLGHEGERLVNYTLTLDGKPIGTHEGLDYGASAIIEYASDYAKTELATLFPDALMVSLKPSDSPFTDEQYADYPDLRNFLFYELALAASRIASIESTSKNMLLYGRAVIDTSSPADSDLGGLQWGRMSINSLLTRHGDEGRKAYKQEYLKLRETLPATGNIILAPVKQLKKAQITLKPQSITQPDGN